MLTHRLVQDETAVARNPRHPDYGGLDVAFTSAVSERGAATVNNFTGWVTDRLKEQANIHKQTRLWNEESRHRTRDYGDHGEKGKGKGKDKDKKKKKGNARGEDAAGEDQ